MEHSWIEGLPPVPEQVVALVLGAVLLLAGRRAFWLTLGIAAFSAGALFSTYLPMQVEAAGRLLLTLGCGLAAVLLGIFLRRVGIAVGGLLIGGLLGLHLAQLFGAAAGGPALWLAVILGGLLGWLLARWLVEGALIVLSSVMGAMVIVQHLPLAPSIDGFVLLGLVLLGIAVQSRRKKS